ncbi:MAG: polyprenyl synthetase family protein [Planctomycetota bacterium]
MNPFDSYLKSWVGPVDSALDAILPPETEIPTSVHSAMRYTVFAGGKRFRPVLVLLSAKAAGGREEEAMPAACAVEMVHAFSLIHDDLPAMDDDDLRRGKPTNHKVYGEAIAILAGDALLDHAFGALADLPRREAIPDAVRDLANAVGSRGLVGGQVEDVEAEGREPDLATVERIHRGKTAALLRGCARLGARAAGASAEDLDRLSEYAEMIGIAFQIVDDVLDETGGDEQFGKTAGKDREVRKMTWPAAVGIEASRERARELAARAREMTAGMPGEEILAGLAERVVARTH